MKTMMLRCRAQRLLALFLLGGLVARVAAEGSALPQGAAKEACAETQTAAAATPAPIWFNAPIMYQALHASNEVHWYSFTITRPYRCRFWIAPGYSLLVSLYGPNSSTRLISQITTGSGEVNMLPPNLGAGQYFITVQLAPGGTQTFGGYSLALYDRNVTSFRINSGAAETTSRQVMLSSQCVSAPAYYKASLRYGFDDTGWIPWKGQVPFKLNMGNDVKTVYFKVKHADGVESEMTSATIVLKETVPLTLGTEWKTGCIQFDREIDWYRFTAPAAGTYLIETQCGSLGDTVMEILDAGGRQLMTANDSGEEYAAKIQAPLAAGKYQVRIHGHFIWERGTYMIRVQRVR